MKKSKYNIELSNLDLIINHFAWNVDMQVCNYHYTSGLHELLHVKFRCLGNMAASALSFCHNAPL